MPSQRKRIGFLPSEEVHEIIDKLCKANEFSQSKVTGILVEEALRSRGVLNDSFKNKSININYLNESFEKEAPLKNNKSLNKSEFYKNKLLVDDIKLMHDFIEYKYFKKVMKQNINNFDL